MQTTESAAPKCSASSAKSVKKARVTPKADIFETETSFGVLLDIPGANQEEIEISLENGVLAVEVEPKSAEIPSYYRRFRLNSSVDLAEVRAKLKHGVLELLLPKRAESQRKIISLSTH